MVLNLEEATKRITFEYLKTGCEGYQTLLRYINGDMKGNLWLWDTKISYLPEGLKVGGTLNLTDTPITSLPNGLVVGGNLYLNNTPITSLPEEIAIDGNLYLYNTPITSLSKGLVVHGRINLCKTPISKMYSEEQLKEMLPNIKGDIIINN